MCPRGAPARHSSCSPSAEELPRVLHSPVAAALGHPRADDPAAGASACGQEGSAGAAGGQSNHSLNRVLEKVRVVWCVVPGLYVSWREGWRGGRGVIQGQDRSSS